jgi:hypothetical protein
MPAMSLEEAYEMYKERARVAHNRAISAKTDEERQEAAYEEATNLYHAGAAAESLVGMWASRISQCAQDAFRALTTKYR